MIMHSLIIGMTESGKTCLALILAKQLRSKGKKVAVLDPLHNPDWDCDFRTTDPVDLQDYLASERSVYVFIDEGGKVFNNGNDLTFAEFATTSRHYGHSVHFMAQRAMQIPKTMRDQCSRLFLFTSSASDGIIHADEWNKDVLRQCNTLPRFHFWHVDRYHLQQRLEVVNYTELRNVAGNDTGNLGNPSNVARNGKVDSRQGKKGQRT